MTSIKTRLATTGDFPTLIDACEQLHHSGNYNEQTAFVAGDVKQVLEHLYEHDERLLLVAESTGDESKIVGMLGLGIIPHIANFSTKMAYEYFWWVNPDVRNSGIGQTLLDDGKQWAKSQQCSILLMQVAKTAHKAVHQALEKQGFNALETNYQCLLN